MAPATPLAGVPALPAPPRGWEWPFNAQSFARGLTPLTVYRPVNVAALRAAPVGACGPVEVAPSVWVTPMCTRLPPLSRSPFARPIAIADTRPREALPLVYDLRAHGLDGPMKDQQSADVCWSFGISSVMENALRRMARQDVVSPLHLVAHFAWRDLQTQGVSRPVAAESWWPYDPHKACGLDQNPRTDPSCVRAYGVERGSLRGDPRLIEEQRRADAAAAFRITAVHSARTAPGDPEELVRIISGGTAVYADFDVNMRAWSAWSLGPGGAIADWTPDGTGGHVVTLTGYRTIAGGAREFLVHNSWGSSWGDGGYGWVSERMVRERLRDAFVVTLAPVTAPPTPAPPPEPTPPPSQGRTACHLTGITSTGETLTPRAVPVGESICTASNAGGSSPGPWLHMCRRASSGASNCGAPSRSAICVAEVTNGRSHAACCPAGATRPTDPGCVSADVLHPVGPYD
ncbi:MAG: hypothetical protein KF915_18525 [Polyangiaceae bacterium]|nr:hypothetical protein [Polyangiaceae bacterium]